MDPIIFAAFAAFVIVMLIFFSRLVCDLFDPCRQGRCQDHLEEPKDDARFEMAPEPEISGPPTAHAYVWDGRELKHVGIIPLAEYGDPLTAPTPHA